MTKQWLLIAMMSAAIGCGGAGKDPPGVGTGSGGVGTGEGTVYTLDLKEFGTTQTPGGLPISNETLAFPLALGPTEQSLSLTNCQAIRKLTRKRH